MFSMNRRDCPNGKSIPAIHGPGLLNAASNSPNLCHSVNSPARRLLPSSSHSRQVIGLLRLAVPPHADNENAAESLRKEIGQDDSALEWCVVRPDSLINEQEDTEYEVYPSPIRSAIFDAGKTSRRNVARFMAELINDDESWHRWQGQMPVIYNKTKT